MAGVREIVKHYSDQPPQKGFYPIYGVDVGLKKAEPSDRESCKQGLGAKQTYAGASTRADGG